MTEPRLDSPPPSLIGAPADADLAATIGGLSRELNRAVESINELLRELDRTTVLAVHLEALADALLGAVDGPAFLVDAAGVVVGWTPGAARAWGVDGQAALGRPAREVVAPELVDVLRTAGDPASLPIGEPVRATTRSGRAARLHRLPDRDGTAVVLVSSDAGSELGGRFGRT